jgi:MoaA/NifB/PqqE/SkfB family radical SAM enzyme
VADLLQKYRLLKGLCTGDRACTGPFYVTLDVTSRCNLLCLGCRFRAAKHRDPCYICWYHSRIKVDGTVLSCGRSELVLGNLKKESFPEIWNGKAYRMERRKRLSPHSFAYRNRICDCEHCAYVQDNIAIHRRLKYLLPFFSRFKEGTEQSPPYFTHRL